MDQYTYRPLPQEPGCIRLLQLLPGSSSDDIRGSIISYKINGERPFGLYEALSYCWGEPSRTQRVLLQHSGDSEFQYLDVTNNLFAALQQLRDHALPRILWIDAVCVNQKNLEERKQQVGLMATIYASAQQVVVWLGQGSADDLGQGYCKPFEHVRNIGKQAVESLHISGAGFEEFLQCEWFTRVWILQEIAAARSLSIMYDGEELPGSIFVRGMNQLFSQHGTQELFSRRTLPTPTWFPAITQLMAFEPLARSANDLQQTLDVAPMADLIEMFHTNGATDRRDKVYAMLGARSDRHTTHDLQPDYEKSWEILFKDLIEHLLGTQVVPMTWEERECAVITATGCVVGSVELVREQSILVNSKKFDRESMNLLNEPAWNASWATRRYTKEIKRGDIVCLLEGARYPTLLRPCRGHFDIIVINLTSTPDVRYAAHDAKRRGLPVIGSGFLEEWFSKQNARPRHKLLLIWDWQHLTSATPALHNDVLISIGHIGSVDHEDIHPSDIEIVRRLQVRRVLDDVWFEDHRWPSHHWREFSAPLSAAPSDPKSLAHIQFDLLSSTTSSEMLHPLLAHADTVRHCIRLLKLWSPKNSHESYVKPEFLLQQWSYESRFDYGILGLVDLANSQGAEYLKRLDLNFHASPRVMYWEFGERQHNYLLRSLFPTYKAQLLAGDGACNSTRGSGLLNGRYLMNLLLGQECFETLPADPLLKRIRNLQAQALAINSGSTRFDSSMRVCLLAVMSEAWKHQLSIDPALIARMRLDEASQKVLTFVFGEMCYDANVVKKIFAKLFVLAESRLLFRTQPVLEKDFLHYFMYYRRKDIIEHLDKLDMGSEAALANDPIFETLYTHFDHVRIRKQDALVLVRQWFASLLTIGEGL